MPDIPIIHLHHSSLAPWYGDEIMDKYDGIGDLYDGKEFCQ